MTTAASLLLIVLAAGLASQWVAWRIGVPVIVVLIATGLMLGPVTGVVTLRLPPQELTGLIGLGVSIILFDGGMALKLGEFRRVGHGVGRLTILGPPLAWLFGSVAAHYLGGLSWPVALVLGAILVVTGPTVILPLLRGARLNKETSSLLKWEGIVNDPVGVLLTVLTFQYLTTAGGGPGKILASLGGAIAAAAVLGGLGGWLTGWLYRRGAVPEHLKSPVLMVLVPVVYWVSNLAQHEAGLLSVTVMGLVMGNMKLPDRETLHQSQENLSIILLSVLFIVIPSRLDASHLHLLNWHTALFVLAIVLLVRPLTIALATLGAPVRRNDKLLLAWIAPRGIVAAATAGIFGPALVAAGYKDADQLLPVTFLVIVVTVLAHGFTIGRMARRLGLAAKNDNGLLIVGASPWSVAFASVLKKLNVDVLLVDGAYHRLKEARMAGIEVFYGEILSEHAEHTLESQHVNHLLCATDNDFYNALACKAQSHRFGVHRVFQLATDEASSQELKRLTLQQRGYFAFDPVATFAFLHQRLQEGWTVSTSKFTASYGWSEFTQRMGERGRDWLLLGGISSDGMLRLYAAEQSFKLEAGWTALYFAPAPAPVAAPEEVKGEAKGEVAN